MFWIAVNRCPVAFDQATFRGPFLDFLTFAQYLYLYLYLLPLAVLARFLCAQQRAGTAGRSAMAAVLLVLTLSMGMGIAVAAMGMWLPEM
ncbi:MAG: hypothetical protein V4857_10680 [Pseudomonadota bacterium]